MLKKTLIIFLLVFFLAACSKQEKVEVDFKGPTSGPDPIKMTPTYWPAQESADAFTLPEDSK